MHCFNDASGREWAIEINRAAVRRLWDLLHVNLHDPVDLGRLCNAERYLLLAQVLTVLLKSQAEKVWPEATSKPAELLDQFDALLEPDEVFDLAHEAFCRELADFSRRHGRVAVATYLDSTPRLLRKETQASLATLPDPVAMEADLDRRLSTASKVGRATETTTPGDSSTSTPASLESAGTS